MFVERFGLKHGSVWPLMEVNKSMLPSVCKVSAFSGFHYLFNHFVTQIFFKKTFVLHNSNKSPKSGLALEFHLAEFLLPISTD